MIRWSGAEVAIEDAVAGTPALSGTELRDRYWAAMRDMTFRLASRRRNSVVMGPLELLRFGEPLVGPRSVEWPIQGGLLAGAPRGRWRVEAVDGTVIASISDFRPSLPRPLYAISHLQIHLLFTRLFLLRLRSHSAPPGVPAPRRDRTRAAVVDVALCLTLNRIFSPRVRPLTAVGILAGYHLACWTISGRTLGGMVMRQRVVAADGRPLTWSQSALRLVTAPLSWIARRPIHDEVAGTAVLVEEKAEGAASAAPP